MAKKKTNEASQENNGAVDLYRIAYETRNLEINLFWQRSNYFLVLNTAIVAGIVLKLGSSDPLVGIFIAFGIFVSWLSYRVNLGSKFWQTRWEQRLSEIEKSISPGANLFSSDPDQIRADVEKSMHTASGGGWWHGLIDKRALTKPSVSRHMILLSIGFICLYVALLAVWLVRIFAGTA